MPTVNVKRGSSDIVLNGVKMTIRRKSDGTLDWNEEPIPFLPERTTDRDVTYGDLPLEEAGTYAIDDFSGGMGQKVQPTSRAEEKGRYYYGYPIDVTIDGSIISAPLQHTIVLPYQCAGTELIECENEVYVLGGRYVLRKGAADFFDLAMSFASGTFVTSAECFQGKQTREHLYVGLGGLPTDPLAQVYNGTAWAASNFRAEELRKFRNELYKGFYDPAAQYLGWAVAKTPDGGVTPTWGASSLVGDAASEITEIATIEDVVYVAKGEGLYDVTAETANQTRDLTGGFIRQLRDPLNGHHTYAWKDYLFYPTARGGLYCRMADGTFFEMGLTSISENDSPIRGRVTAMAGDSYWLYAALQNPLNNESYICKARVSGFDPTGKPEFAWHGALAVYTGGVTLGAMLVSSVGGQNPRLYVARSDYRVDYYVLPRVGPDPIRDLEDGGEVRARSTSLVYLPEFHGTFFAHPKDYESDSIEPVGTSPGLRYVDEEYRLPPDTDWITLGRFESDYPAPIEFQNASGKRLDRRLTLITDKATAYVKIRAIALSYAVRFPDKPRFVFTVEAERNADMLQGYRHRHDPEEIITAIRQSKAATGAVAMTTPYGQQYEVRVTSWRRLNMGAETARPMAWFCQVYAVGKHMLGNLAVYDVSIYDGGDVYA